MPRCHKNEVREGFWVLKVTRRKDQYFHCSTLKAVNIEIHIWICQLLTHAYFQRYRTSVVFVDINGNWDVCCLCSCKALGLLCVCTPAQNRSFQDAEPEAGWTRHSLCLFDGLPQNLWANKPAWKRIRPWQGSLNLISAVPWHLASGPQWAIPEKMRCALFWSKLFVWPLECAQPREWQTRTIIQIWLGTETWSPSFHAGHRWLSFVY